MNIKEFKQIKPGTVFAGGVLPNSPKGLFMSPTGGELHWLAIKGYANDWCIYCSWSFHNIDWIKAHGDKVVTEINIRKCVPCDDEVFKAYRY
ncbi:hypothetical protein ES707_06688 [subsurface metagenome]